MAVKLATEDLETMARACFDAYNGAGANPWKTFDGRAVPTWSQVTEDVRTKWRAAAEFAWMMGYGAAVERQRAALDHVPLLPREGGR